MSSCMIRGNIAQAFSTANSINRFPDNIIVFFPDPTEYSNFVYLIILCNVISVCCKPCAQQILTEFTVAELRHAQHQASIMKASLDVTSHQSC